jgi:hypothetical protein
MTERQGAPARISPLAATGRPEQLSLLTTPQVPLQFRLDERTRRRGIAQVEQLRRQLAERAAQRGEALPARQVAAPSRPATPRRRAA